MAQKKNIVLIGFMGTGKTAVGKALARRLGRRLVDIDRNIEENQGRKISEIFEKDGEPRFRALEKEAILKAAKLENSVITTGGGAALDPENIRALRMHGWVILLSADPGTIHERVKDGRQRPLLRGEDILTQIKKLLEAREPYYASSDFQFQTDGKTPEEVSSLIIETLEKEGGLE